MAPTTMCLSLMLVTRILCQSSEKETSIKTLNIFLMLFSNLVNCNLASTSESLQIIHAAVGSNVTLHCSLSSKQRCAWDFNNGSLYINNIPTEEQFQTSVSLSEDYSLQIDPVALNHEGVYECRQDSSTLATYKLVTEVRPDLTLFINGKLTSKATILIEEGKETHVSCFANGARPKVNLTLNGVWETVSASYNTNQQNAYIFDTFSRLVIVLRNVTGMITCSSSDQVTFPGGNVRVKFKTYVTPTVNVSINNNERDVTVPIEVGETITALCSAYGARPPAQLTWFVNHRPLSDQSSTVSGTDVYLNTRDVNTFDSTSSLTYLPKDINGTITCVSKHDAPRGEQSKHATYFTFMLPIMNLTINGQSGPVVIVDKREVIYIECIIIGSRPAVTITWFLDNIPVSPSIIQTNMTYQQSDGTFDSESSLRIINDANTGNITCVCDGLPVGRLLNNISFRRFAIGSTEANQIIEFRVLGPIIGSVTLALITIIGLVTCIWFCVKGTDGKIAETSRISFRQTSTTVKSLDSLSHDLSESSSLEKNLKRMSSTLNPPNLTLPEIPETISSNYTGVPGEESGHYYSTMKETVSNERLFPRKDVCFILNKKSRSIYNRWMGTISAPGKKICVVLTTIKDNVLETGIFHWDEYVKRLLDVPSVKTIAQVEGICIDEATLYVVHEYLTCETLQTVIEPRQLARASTFLEHITLNTTISSYVKDILEGMEFIQSYGFLHPGLTTKKVLVTTQKTCKLYDFCLAEDATNKIKIIKTKADCKLLHIAPEAVQRNEYNRASDVWSTALVIWNLMFEDDLRECLESVLSKGRRISSETKKLENVMKYETLCQCFEPDSAQRPTMSTLRQYLRQEFNQNKMYEVPNNRRSRLTDTYVPMKGHMSDTDRLSV